MTDDGGGVGVTTMTWTCEACGDARCRGGEFCAAWMGRKVSAGSGAYLREPTREVRSKVYETGQTRRLDGRTEGKCSPVWPAFVLGLTTGVLVFYLLVGLCGGG